MSSTTPTGSSSVAFQSSSSLFATINSLPMASTTSFIRSSLGSGSSTISSSRTSESDLTPSPSSIATTVTTRFSTSQTTSPTSPPMSFPIPIGPPTSPPFDPPQTTSSTSTTTTSATTNNPTSTSTSTSSPSFNPPFPSTSQPPSTSLPYSPSTRLPSSSRTGQTTPLSSSRSSNAPSVTAVTPPSTPNTVGSLTVTSQGQVMTMAPSVVTVFVPNTTDSRVITQTSVVSNPTLSPNIGSSEASSRPLSKGAVAAISVVVVLVLLSFIIWGIFMCRRRSKQKRMESDTASAAMAAAGITRAPPLDDDDRWTPVMAQRQRTFEDGAPFTSVLDPDIERSVGDFNPYHEGFAVVGSRGTSQPGTIPRRGSSFSSQQPLASPSSYGHGEPPPVYANRSSSHGHDTSYSGHEPLIASSSGSSHSPSAYATLTGSFQPRRSLPHRGSSEESHAPPVPQHILTSFASPHYKSVQRDEDVTSAQSVYSQSDEADVGAGLSPLDPTLGSRLQGANESGASVSLRDNEDYSARQKLEIRNLTGSQRTFGTME